MIHGSSFTAKSDFPFGFDNLLKFHLILQPPTTKITTVSPNTTTLAPSTSTSTTTTTTTTTVSE